MKQTKSALLQSGPIILVEPEINPITARVGLPTIANYPPLAQARLAAQIGDDVRIVDLRIPGERRRFLQSIRRQPPALVGLSVTFTSNGDEAIRTAAEVRRASPRTVIVFGGTAPSEDALSFWDAEVDFIGFRKGDVSLAELVRTLRREGAVPEQPPGFFYREEGVWKQGPPVADMPMAALRPYAWHLLPRRYWRHYYQGFRPVGMSQTSQGCPFDCTFCSVWKTQGRRIDLASLDNIKHDFESLPPFVRGFFFADDIWMQASEQQLRELYDPLLEWMVSDYVRRRPDVALTVETRTDLFLRQIERFEAWRRRAHLQHLLFGIEAVTDEQLKDYSKRNTIDTNSEAIQTAARLGFLVSVQLVLPLQADRAYFDEVVRFLEFHRPYINTTSFTIVTPLPGTDLYEDLLSLHPDLGDRSVVRHPAFSLFTALSPTQMETAEFYAQVARVNRVADPSGKFIRDGFGALRRLLRSPWLIPRLLRAVGVLRALSRTQTYMEIHRTVQGERLLSAPAASAQTTERPAPSAREGVAAGS